MGRSRKRKVTTGGNGGGPPISPEKWTRFVSKEEYDRLRLEEAAAHTAGREGEVQVGGGNSSQSDSGGAAEKLNPLFIGVILDNIFIHLDPRSLRRAREVCSTWLDVSVPVWRSSGITLTLKLQHCTLKSWYNYRLRMWTTQLGRFLEFWEEQCRDAPPYRQFCLRGWQFEDVVDPEVTRFWQLVGGSIKKLTLVNCTAPQPNAFFKVVNQSCPNLETLNLEDCVFSDFESYFARMTREAGIGFQYELPAFGGHPHLKSLSVNKTGETGSAAGHPALGVTWLELFSHFPHLSSFQGIPNEWNGYRNDLDKLRALTWVREQDGRNLPLKQLHVENPVDFGRTGGDLYGPDQRERREVMALVHPLNIPMTSIRLAWDMDDANEIKKLIQLHGPALVTLLAGNESLPESLGDFPFGVRLEHLKVLEISHYLCDNLTFLKTAPNLEILRLEDAEALENVGEFTRLISNTPIKELAGLRLLHLTTLELQYFVSDKDLGRLVKWMPEVINVEMFLYDSQFPIVCQAWKKLKRLKVYGEELTDRGVTGIKNLRVPDAAFRKGKVLPPNITQLRDLQVFDAPNSKLTDVSVTHGLIKICPVLRHVFIRNTQITDAAKRTLHENYVKIDFGFVDPDVSDDDDQ